MKSFLVVDNDQLIYAGKPILLQGFGLGNWLHIEHFMIGLPGAEHQMNAVIRDIYGKENAEEFWEKYRNCYVDEPDFALLRELGINTVRIPFNYRMFVDDNAPFEINDAGFAHLDRVLALCQKYRILGVLDLHTVPGGENPDWHSDNAIGESLFWQYRCFRDQIISLWKHIAHRYRDNEWVGGYDLINEPAICFPDHDLLLSFYHDLCDEIRQVDTNHVFFVEGDEYARDFRMFSDFPDKNSAFSFHFYPVQYHDHSILGTAEGMKTACESIIKSVSHLKRALKRPIWCGETAPVRSAGVDRTDSTRALLEYLESENIGWSIWAYKYVRPDASLVAPQPDGSWMKLSTSVMEDWNLRRSFQWGLDEGRRLYDLLNEPEIDPHRHWHLKFRFMANEHYPLLQKFRRALSKIPFEDFMKLPEDFLYSNCIRNTVMYDTVNEFVRFGIG